MENIFRKLYDKAVLEAKVVYISEGEEYYDYINDIIYLKKDSSDRVKYHEYGHYIYHHYIMQNEKWWALLENAIMKDVELIQNGLVIVKPNEYAFIGDAYYYITGNFLEEGFYTHSKDEVNYVRSQGEHIIKAANEAFAEAFSSSMKGVPEGSFDGADNFTEALVLIMKELSETLS